MHLVSVKKRAVAKKYVSKQNHIVPYTQYGLIASRVFVTEAMHGIFIEQVKSV